NDHIYHKDVAGFKRYEFSYKLRQRYGDIFSLQMTWKPMVVVNGLKAVREVLVNRGEDTSDHPPIPIFNFLGYGHKSKGNEL
ncbi:cytochrome P450 2D20-like, partial [Sigmodon hispidus]